GFGHLLQLLPLLLGLLLHPWVPFLYFSVLLIGVAGGKIVDSEHQHKKNRSANRQEDQKGVNANWIDVAYLVSMLAVRSVFADVLMLTWRHVESSVSRVVAHRMRAIQDSGVAC